MDYRLSDLVDIEKVQEMMDEFYQLTGIPHGIIDVEGNVLSAIGWQEVCMAFHRRHVETARRCRISDNTIASRLNEKDGYIIYKCLNGMIDAATPIMISGVHVATLFLGQVFSEPPDVDFFRQQAETYGFDVEAYLAAVMRVPIFTEGKLHACMRYFRRLAVVIADMWQKQLQIKQTEESLRKTNDHLEQLVNKRTEQISKMNMQLLNDISKRKQIEMELRKNEACLRTLINASPDLIGFKDGEGRWLEANDACLKTFGLEGINYIGKKNNQLAEMSAFQGEALRRLDEVDTEAWARSSMIRVEQTIPQAGGQETILDVIKVPLYYPDGQRQGLVILGRDITELKQADKNKRLLQETLQYDKLKTEFFANLSHEFRTPLNVIFSTVQLLEGYMGGQSLLEKEKLMKYNHVMKQNCFRLLRLINNLIDITKIDTDFYGLHLQNCDMVSILENITLSVAEYIESKNLNLVFDTDSEEKIIACDPDKIERIMLNLLSNAVKFSNPGGSIDVNVHDKGESIVISVKDSGIGIKNEKQKIIFERFRQVDKSFTRHREGSGIGLSLVQSLVEMHGGSIYVESEYGKGSEFIIELPVRVLDEERQTGVEPVYMEESNMERIQVEFSDIY